MPDHPHFPMGQLYVTKAACEVLAAPDVAEALTRHSLCDWGDVGPEDAKANADALREGGRILSVYRSVEGYPFWVVTEEDRSATVVLLPDDY